MDGPVTLKELIAFSFGSHKLWNVGWGTYFTLRTGLTTLAFALPLVLWWGGDLFCDLPLQGSISAYHHAGGGALRDVFVGTTVAVAGLLIVYKGFTGFENWALNIGGGALVAVAFVPDDQSTGLSDALPWLHTLAAVIFFMCLAYVAFIRSGDTLGLLPVSAQRYFQRFYWITGGLMAAAVVLAAFVAWWTGTGRWVFTIESGGVWAFAIYWYLKTLEMRVSHADALAGRQQLRRPAYGWRDMFKPIRIEELHDPSSP